jgi:hypothetical protein
MPAINERTRFDALCNLARTNYGDLTPAEVDVLRRSTSATNIDPQEVAPRLKVGANFLEWLATDKDAIPYISHRGISVANASITWRLNLDSSVIPFPLRFDFCDFDWELFLRNAQVRSLHLLHCRLNSDFYADGLHTLGDLFLRDTKSNASISLSDAQIGGNLHLETVDLTSPVSEALSAPGIRINGNLTLTNGVKSHGTLILTGAQIDGDFRCSDATMTTNFSGGGISAARMRITGSLTLGPYLKSDGPLYLSGARIGGDFRCGGTTLSDSYLALAADQAIVGGAVEFGSRGDVGAFKCSGMVSVSGADISGTFTCRNATLIPGNQSRIALRVEGTRVHGDFTLEGLSNYSLMPDSWENGIHSSGEIYLQGIQVGGDLSCVGTKLTGGPTAIDLESARVTGSVFLKSSATDTFSAEGGLDLIGIQVGGDLDCRGAVLLAEGTSLTADNSTVNGSVNLTDGFTSRGTVRFLGSMIASNLKLDGARLDAGGDSLRADKAVISGNAYFRSKFRTSGSIVLQDATINGNLVCEDAALSLSGNALVADRLKVKGAIRFVRSLTPIGTVRLDHCETGDNIELDGAILGAEGTALSLMNSNVGKSVVFKGGSCSAGLIDLAEAHVGTNIECLVLELKQTGVALSANRARISGSMICSGDFSCSGRVQMVGAEVGGNVECIGSKIREFECDGMRISGNLTWTHIRNQGEAELSLRGTAVGTLTDDRGSWPAKNRLHISGFVYKNLVSDDADPGGGHGRVAGGQAALRERAVLGRIDWLNRQPDTELRNPQPWLELASLLDSEGNPDGAKYVLYRYHRQIALNSGPVGRIASLPYDLLQEEPLWITPIIASLGCVSAFLFWRAYRIHAMVPTDKDALAWFKEHGEVPEGYPPFNPVAYSFENVLPVVKLGQDSAWAPNHGASRETWLPERPRWARTLGNRWGPTRWLFRLTYGRLAFLRWFLIVFGWAAALVLAAAIAARFKS